MLVKKLPNPFLRFGVTCLFLAIVAAGSFAVSDDNRTLAQLLQTDGVRMPDGSSFPLLPPSLNDKQTAEQQRDVLEELSGKLGWEKFARPSPVAPVTIRVSYLKDASGERIGHDVHSAFIAYASMETLRDRDLMETMFGASAKGQKEKPAVFEALTVEQRERLGITADASDSETYGKMALTLLKKIELHGVVHMQKREGDNWFQLFWQIDPTFSESTIGEPANTWIKFAPNEVGKLTPTSPKPYLGCGGYVTVYATGQAENQILVESRLILHEPVEWFAGSNSLRSKLPLTLQESARNFRRKLPK